MFLHFLEPGLCSLCITFTEMCLLSFETSSLLFYCFRFYFLLMMDIAKSETFKNFIILNKALLFLIKNKNHSKRLEAQLSVLS